jgi:ribosomal protein L29
MSLAYVDEAHRLGKMLEDRQARRDGSNVEEARKVVARKLGAAPGTLRNLRKRRLKDVGAGLLDGLRAYVVRELHEEARQLDHEAQLLLASGAHPDSGALAEIRQDLARIKSVLVGEKSP